MPEKVRWGILSTARIGITKVIPAMQQGECCEITAIASRDFERARQTANELQIARAYGTYDQLLSDPQVDAIYNPLPNHLHVPWSIKALEAGKHVLCEKPIGLSVAEAEQLVAASSRYPRLKLMEAFMYRHHPQWRTARDWVREGRIGQLRTIQSFFSYYNEDPENVRNQSNIGGGGLMDIGCYCISLSRFIFESEPDRVVGVMEYDPKMEIDRLASAILQFPAGTATFTCSTQLVPHQSVHIFGTTGSIEIEIPFNAPSDRPCLIALTTESGREEIPIPVCDQYTIQGDLFAQAILDDTPVPTPIADAVDNMRVIERIVSSANQSAWR